MPRSIRSEATANEAMYARMQAHQAMADRAAMRHTRDAQQARRAARKASPRYTQRPAQAGHARTDTLVTILAIALIVYCAAKGMALVGILY